MKFNLVLLSLIAPLAASQCLLDNADSITFEVRNECTYDKVLVRIRQAKNAVRAAGATNCLSHQDELGSLLGLSGDDEAAMEAKINSICDEAISKSRSDADYVVNFEGIELIESDDQETIARFLKEFYDGGTFLNEFTQQRGGGGESYNLNRATQGIRKFYVGREGPASNNIVSWPSSAVDNFESCENNAVMCCWVQDRQADDDNGNCATPYPNVNVRSADVWTPDSCIDKDPADNTDICYVDMSRSPTSNHVKEGGIIFDDKPGVREGDAHCHGFAWADDNLDDSHRYRGNNLFYVSMYDHLRVRGYVREVPGAPMCGCLEKMPTVTRSDCTELAITEDFDFVYEVGKNTFSARITDANVEFNACQGVNDNNNDLLSHIRLLAEENKINLDEAAVDEILVGDDNCAPAVESFLETFGIQRN